MKAKNEFEYLVALLQEYIERMPPATKLAVSSHAQQCVTAVAKELETADVETSADPTPETPPAVSGP